MVPKAKEKFTGKVVMHDNDMRRAVSRLAHEIVEKNRGVKDIVLVGILNRGLPIANRIAKEISKNEGASVLVGSIDVSLYRDDLSIKGEYVEVKKSDMPFSVDGKIVVLVDDVIFAGRTARAALDGLKDYGRASKVQLCALVDRGHREVPIHPDFTGKYIPTAKKERVSVEVLEMDGVDRVIIE
ncbi:bifunctional pyr operon transcriptional regulator/uracil phosphoribosyltransferase [candidate division WOR-1 bacterium RIFOXYA12_FULL_43_27]|uniref:Bifunctional protein PyrR n=1 Tax=candidate division WOR-1 bacterium RIFOXYC2_FULL_46_14 TaxID=1802587 RepID=A0A1F4U5Y1_UNCSA|nr:MAG: bifunctional pyr operon transcriptional regulator/uracil phosphoribosyltransferase [candidate division WOR-1 bacterium RIFOXYA12_FULL_43_27]OGC20466.1 MAG: bifunctional pyr operon transcriptional regulator/uracil phosphoribosyltransferase [candidate division WOR-1 bacterium RIFOXYB2_FULL_46_45]OGC31797.1 MAG: bifunctional pyr operon transcriptional regulator/uracil phosphoribosyltransferase [candidate division WOR-1 bacterium RIFOXYA2_FULL_46_56]OGC40311.1 MAG: bifunctional pyr operon tr